MDEEEAPLVACGHAATIAFTGMGLRRRRERTEESGTERPFFFLHLMKTAGTTFVRQVQEIFGVDHVYPHALEAHRSGGIQPYSRVESLLGLSPEERAPIRVYAGHFPFAAYEMFGIDAVTMTILRDPVDRTVSMLKHCKRDIEQFRHLDLDEIYDRRFVRVAFVDNFQAKQFAFTPEDAPESCLDKLVVDEDRLELAKANLDSVDVVGVTEQFDVFLDRMHRRFGWQFTDLGNRNVSREQWDVSPALRARIAEDNRLDIEFYEHARGLVER